MQFFFTALSCGSNQINRENGDAGKTAARSSSDSNGERYENEGFISGSLYRIIIVLPSDGAIDETDFDKQARNKALASLKKYISSRNKSLTANTNAQILNLISDYGKVKRAAVGGKRLYVLDISRQGLRETVDSFGQ